MVRIKRKEETPSIEVGDKVKLRGDVLVRHARSVPAHAGYTREGFAWRETLNKYEGKTGRVTRTFPGSRHVNVSYPDGKTIGIDSTELVKTSPIKRIRKDKKEKPLKISGTGISKAQIKRLGL